MAEIDPAQDGQLELKKRARRRLVGAVALALLAVIVLPMVMDQEPRPLTQDIQIRIPTQDAAAPRSSVVAAPAAAEAKPAAIPAKPEQQTKPPAPLSKSEPPKPASSPQVAQAARPVEPVEQAKLPESKSDGKPEALHEQWVVQLGAYQDQANVKHLLAKLKGLGYPSYTEKVDTAQGPRTRVRGGPFATRKAAERAQAQMKKIGAGGPSGGIVAQK